MHDVFHRLVKPERNANSTDDRARTSFVTDTKVEDLLRTLRCHDGDHDEPLPAPVYVRPLLTPGAADIPITDFTMDEDDDP